MCIVGRAATHESGADQESEADQNQALFGISLICLGQISQAFQYVWEEKVGNAPGVEIPSWGEMLKIRTEDVGTQNHAQSTRNSRGG